MYAVIQTGGKQYRVAEGDRIDVELLAGDDVTLQPVLLVDGDDVFSTPSALEGAPSPRGSWARRRARRSRASPTRTSRTSAGRGATASTTPRSRSPGSPRPRARELNHVEEEGRGVVA